MCLSKAKTDGEQCLMDEECASYCCGEGNTCNYDCYSDINGVAMKIFLAFFFALLLIWALAWLLSWLNSFFCTLESENKQDQIRQRLLDDNESDKSYLSKPSLVSAGSKQSREVYKALSKQIQVS